MFNYRSFVSNRLLILSVVIIACLIDLGFSLFLPIANSKPLPDKETRFLNNSSTTIFTSTVAVTFTPKPILTQTPTTSPTTTRTSELTAARDPSIEEQLAGMTVKQKVSQIIMTGVSGNKKNSTACNSIQQLEPGAIVLTKSNVSTPDQLRTFVTSLQNCAQKGRDFPLLIAIDHEGQYVNRFDRGITVFPSAMAVGATWDSSLAFKVALASGQELSYCGINMILGPVADVLTNYDNTYHLNNSGSGGRE